MVANFCAEAVEFSIHPLPNITQYLMAARAAARPPPPSAQATPEMGGGALWHWGGG